MCFVYDSFVKGFHEAYFSSEMSTGSEGQGEGPHVHRQSNAFRLMSLRVRISANAL